MSDQLKLGCLGVPHAGQLGSQRLKGKARELEGDNKPLIDERIMALSLHIDNQHELCLPRQKLKPYDLLQSRAN